MNQSKRLLYAGMVRVLAGCALLLSLTVSTALHAQGAADTLPAGSAATSRRGSAKKDVAANSLDDYLRRVHALSAANVPAPGAIWTESGRLSQMTSDVRARHVHDLVSVIVSETLDASTDGTVKGSRSSAAQARLTAIFQKLSASSAAQNLLNMNASSSLNAQGQSANNSSLSTVLGGEVIEVLPSGLLVVEAARQVEFSQQTQTIVLRGLVRPEDVSPLNRVFSTAISDLTLQVRGNGIVTDYTHRPNVLVRLLQKALIF